MSFYYHSSNISNQLALSVKAVILIRSYLKKVFWPNLFVGCSVQILEILEYSSGLNLAAASILNQNPFFEMASR